MVQAVGHLTTVSLDTKAEHRRVHTTDNLVNGGWAHVDWGGGGGGGAAYRWIMGPSTIFKMANWSMINLYAGGVLVHHLWKVLSFTRLESSALTKARGKRIKSSLVWFIHFTCKQQKQSLFVLYWTKNEYSVSTRLWRWQNLAQSSWKKKIHCSYMYVGTTRNCHFIGYQAKMCVITFVISSFEQRVNRYNRASHHSETIFWSCGCMRSSFHLFGQQKMYDNLL